MNFGQMYTLDLHSIVINDIERNDWEVKGHINFWSKNMNKYDNILTYK